MNTIMLSNLGVGASVGALIGFIVFSIIENRRKKKGLDDE